VDVRKIEDVEPVVEHNGTVPVWWLVKPREMFEMTKGGHLELVNEFEVAGGGYVFPHDHPTHEFYYVTSGRGTMIIGDEEREIQQGDLVHIPPNTIHSLRPRRSTASVLRSPNRARERSTTPSIKRDRRDPTRARRSPR
jgi:quercetin dioxygenase-like cupin family protein